MRLGHAILRYPADATGYFQQHKRRSYPKTRTDFPLPAYVLLTREVAPGVKERHGQDYEEGCRGSRSTGKRLPDLIAP